MKIIALSTSPYPPESSPMAQRLHCYMLALKSYGHDVSVVYCADKIDYGEYEGIPYKSLVFQVQNSRIYSKIYLNSLRKILSDEIKNCDVFFHSEHRLSTILAIQKEANKYGTKIVNELNEYPYCAKSRRLELDSLRYLKQKIFWKYVVPKIQGIIAISHALEEVALQHNKNVVRIPVLSKHVEIKRQLTTNVTEPYILHAGALSETKDGIKALLKAFNLATKELNGNVKLIFTNKQTFPSLIKWIDSFIVLNNLGGCVEFKGTVTNEVLNDLYENCALAVVNKPVNLQNSYNFPTKLTELLPRAIPLIVSKTAELNYFFKHEDNALLVEPNNYHEISKSIVKLIRDHDLSNRIGINGRKLAKTEFHYSVNALKLNNFFNQILICNDK